MPNGARDRQVLCGETVSILATSKGWYYVQTAKDGYCGYVFNTDLGSMGIATHTISAPATHVYSAADLKSREQFSLTFGSRISAAEIGTKFVETEQGFIPIQHIKPIDDRSADPAEIAKLFLGTPYLWGGNSRWGIDCSGLVQAALLACGIPCPGDSDQQMTLGTKATGAWQRNDLLFWKGHVALVVDAETMIHANAHAMAVTYEPIKTAISRIEISGDGPVTAHRRL